jgi:RNA polymerase sigma factor for flagellar operon FliA
MLLNKVLFIRAVALTCLFLSSAVFHAPQAKALNRSCEGIITSPHFITEKEIPSVIKEYQPLISRTSRLWASKLTKNNDYDEVYQNALIGFYSALKDYDSSKGTTLWTFVQYRMRGEVIDQLRETDWLSRKTRSALTSIEKMRWSLIHKLGREPNSQELSSALNMDMADFQQYSPLLGSSLVSLEQLIQTEGDHFSLKLNDDQNPTYSTVAAKEHLTLTLSALERLPVRTQQIVAMIIIDKKSNREIAAELNLDPTRVTQLVNSAIERFNRIH